MNCIKSQIIAHIHTDFGSKFGVPRQSGVVEGLQARIVFEPEFRVAEAFRGLEDFSHLWLIWQFSEVKQKEWSPTVRPPRLGGNKRMGVFATRSPFRPNPIGLSSVKLLKIDWDCAEAPVLVVAGADLMNLTPIIDIKPYLPYTDSHTDATGGFTDALHQGTGTLKVVLSDTVAALLPQEKLQALIQVLECDPRPHYQQDVNRVYGMDFAGINIRFKVENDVLTVL